METRMIGQLNDHSIGIIMKEIVRRAITTIRNERLAFEVHAKPGHSGEMDDILTTADIKAQSVYLRSIRECFPDCGLIAEEDDLAIPSGNGAYFTVDPLDGTRAFARRQSHGIGSMLALVCDGDARGKHVAAAFIGDINTEEIYGYRPGSSRVHRINQYNTWSELQYEGRAGKAGYILLRDPPSYYSPASRAMIERYQRAFDDVRREFGRLGVPVVRAMQRESMQLILDRMEQLRVAGIRRHTV